ncbi:MAG: N-acetylneuraminate synthase family protein [Verrucomicrobiota bacterium]
MLYIAEIGLNYNGNFDLTYEMIRQAKHAGADIAKFQCGWRQGKDEINHLNPERLLKLKRWCDYFEIEFACSVFTQESYAMVKEAGATRFKIASRTVKDDPDLVEKVVAENRDTIISLGMWGDESKVPIDSSEVHYLYCKSIYPSEPWDMVELPKNFEESRYSGYSDHTVGIETALIAIVRGAKIIEKHLTLDKSDTTIRDHALSATPEEFGQMVRLGRDIEKKLSLGV